MKSLGDIIERNAKIFPDKLAFAFGRLGKKFTQYVTFREFRDRVYRLINYLNEEGFEKGDRLAILSKNSIEYMEVYGVGERGGFTIVPINFRLAPDEIKLLLNHSESRVLFFESDYLDVVKKIESELDSVERFISVGGRIGDYLSYEVVMSKSHITEPEIQIESDDVVYLMYTSGTTGLPKGVMLSHKGQIENAKALLMEQALVRDDTHLAIMPLYHVGGRALPLSHTLRSCTVFIRDKFDPKQFLEDVEHYRITTTQLVPTMISFILEVPEVKKYDMGSLRTVWYASSPMPLALLKKTLEVFGDTLIQGYGLTEAGPLVTALHKEDHQIGDEASEGRLQSAGFPAIGVTVRIVDNNMNDVPVGELGEIAVKSDFIMKGYWKMDEETNKTLKNGWLLTGDIGKLDERGYIYVVDRKKDVIISGGENIYPREVEEILYQHPAVLEAAVIGVPDEVWGENVMAVIVLKEGARTTEDEIIQFCKERLASYKKPKIVKFIDNLPKNPSGKILKYELRKRYAEKN